MQTETKSGTDAKRPCTSVIGWIQGLRKEGDFSTELYNPRNVKSGSVRGTMNRISASIAVFALCIALFACSAASQTAQGGAKLEAQDYIDIRQLIEGYSQI